MSGDSRLLSVDVVGEVPSPKFREAVKRALRRGIARAEAKAKENANAPAGSHPMVRTGNLRSKIYGRLINQFAAVLGDPVEYASAIENGATINRPEIRPKNKKALRFTVGGKVVFARRVKPTVIRIPAYPFLWPALDDSADAIGRDIVAEVTKEFAE